MTHKCTVGIMHVERNGASEISENNEKNNTGSLDHKGFDTKSLL